MFAEPLPDELGGRATARLENDVRATTSRSPPPRHVGIVVSQRIWAALFCPGGSVACGFSPANDRRNQRPELGDLRRIYIIHSTIRWRWRANHETMTVRRGRRRAPLRGAMGYPPTADNPSRKKCRRRALRGLNRCIGRRLSSVCSSAAPPRRRIPRPRGATSDRCRPVPRATANGCSHQARRAPRWTWR